MFGWFDDPSSNFPFFPLRRIGEAEEIVDLFFFPSDPHNVSFPIQLARKKQPPSSARLRFFFPRALLSFPAPIDEGVFFPLPSSLLNFPLGIL